MPARTHHDWKVTNDTAAMFWESLSGKYWFGWILPIDVTRAMGVEPATDADKRWLELCTSAVQKFLFDVRADLPLPVNTLSGPYSSEHKKQYDTRHGVSIGGDDRIKMGLIMLATSWYTRRGTGDVEAYAEFGGPPPAINRDIEVLLGINRGFRAVAI